MMKSLQDLKSLAKGAARRASPWIPRGLGRAPYQAALASVQSTASLPGMGAPQVWPRHSYVLGTFKPLVSDLDLTLWYEKSPSVAELDRLNAALARLRSLFPMLGEVNSYTAEEAHAYASLLNRFELDRDPELASRLGEDSLNPAEIRLQAGVFLIRMIDADVNNLLHHPSLRVAKWKEHLNQVEEATSHSLTATLENAPDDFLLSLLIRLAVDVLGFETRNEEIAAVEVLENYYRHVGAGCRLEELAPSEMGWALLPHRFRFSGDRIAPGLKGRLATIFAQQLGWEIWGLMSQYRNPCDRDGFVSHLHALAAAARTALDADSTEGKALTLECEGLAARIQRLMN